MLRKKLWQFLMIFLFFSSCPARSQGPLGILADEIYLPLAQKLSLKLKATLIYKSSPDLCDYSRLLIIGPKKYLEAKKIKCPGQKRLVANILYPSLFRLEENEILISPLPSAQSLERFGSKWVVLYSAYLSYYVKHLKAHLRIKEFLLEDHQSLPEALSRIPEDWAILLLPDPVLLHPKSRKYLKLYLLRKRAKGLDLLGIEGLPWPRVKYSEEAIFKNILRALISPESQKIYFCEVFP